MVQVDREKAGRLGVSMQAVNDTLNDAFGQRQISTIYAQANQYRVILEAMPRYQQDPAALSKLYVPGAGGVQVPLGTLARFEHDLGAARDRARGAVSVGDHQLQSRARRRAERRGGRDRRGRARHRHAARR